jgi:cytochrome P450
MERCPVHGFDHHSHEYAADPVAYNREVREHCPIAWSDAYGGFWAVTRYEDVARVARDDATFSSRDDAMGRPMGQAGVAIPGSPRRLYPITLDPPEFLAYRRLLNPAFAPVVVERLKEHVREVTDACIDAHIESGEIDLIDDVAAPVPGITTLALMGLPVEEWKPYSQPYHDSVAFPPGTPEHDRARRETAESLVRLRPVIAERREDPRDDLISRLTQATIDGEPLSEDAIVAICDLVLGGGVDTTTALIGHAFNYLGEHPELRSRLVGDTDLMDSFCEEMLRFHTPLPNQARTVTRDVEVSGVQMHAGDRVLISWGSANHDPEAFDRPDELIVDRPANRHTAFGLGAHRCIGSSIARAEFQIVVREVCRRLPAYELIDPAVRYQAIGVIDGWHRLPARFTPGRRGAVSV